MKQLSSRIGEYIIPSYLACMLLTMEKDIKSFFHSNEPAGLRNSKQTEAYKELREYVSNDIFKSIKPMIHDDQNGQLVGEPPLKTPTLFPWKTS